MLLKNIMMNKSFNEYYDVIVIGAGIGGLTSANYVAKSGLKVLLVEQHYMCGGCCTSFKRKGYTFDAGGHFYGSLGDKGIMRKILSELDIKQEFNPIDPVDKLIFPDYSVTINRNIDNTIKQLKQIFPEQSKSIKQFFDIIVNFDHTMILKYSKISFKGLLDEYFSDDKLKSMFDVMLLYIGVTTSKVSAVTAIILYRDFILDGGYYPKGGMQNISDAFASRLKEFGGRIILSTKVEEIIVDNRKICGIRLNNGGIIKSKYVVSNADALQTYTKLIEKKHLSNKLIEKLNTLDVSVSHFIVYLGVNSKAIEKINDRCNTWYVPDYNVEKIYDDMLNNPFVDNGFVHIAFPSFYDENLAPKNCESIFLTILASYNDKDYWIENKNNLMKHVIKRAKNILPDLEDNINYSEVSTPNTIHRYTLNHNGANYGWAMTKEQSNRNRLNQQTEIDGLYLAGHWTQPGAGLATVAISGYNAAKLILNRERG